MDYTFMDDFKDYPTKWLKMQEKILTGMETLMDVEYEFEGSSQKELVLEIDKMKLYHYEPKVKNLNKYPLLITYALVNRQYMMDLQEGRSLINNLLEGGQDIYIIDWGYPTDDDQFIQLEDYINFYMDACVDKVRELHNLDQINMLGVCQGGTFTLMYVSLHPEKVKNVITLVTPVEFSTNDGLLFRWGKDLDMSKIVEAMGNVSGDFMNAGFLLLKPYDLMIDKYLNVVNDLDDPVKMANFIRMESWIFDSPAQNGRTVDQFITWMYHENRLAKGELELSGQKVDLKNVTQPLLNIVGLKDNQIPPSATRPIMDLVGSKDKTMLEFDTGHIGIFVSGKSQKEVGPKINEFLNTRQD